MAEIEASETRDLIGYRVIIREDGRLDVAGPADPPAEKYDLFAGDLAFASEEEAARVVAAVSHYVTRRLLGMIEEWLK